ncbi:MULTISPECIES: Frag1/DRAM/Sfk1 family protein [Shimia]|uniref:Frag1/DRAM/Sfk1 family protein n=1 Tax=Shimia TaxID=573139 RepID=UPI001FB2BD48|nr:MULTISPECIES: Frag1/DRAM/Sfk1 family protein [Shimia]MDV4146175.1 Frag1/DRAM/Sfk1 family protein [Shimia sp. FJ5]
MAQTVTRQTARLIALAMVATGFVIVAVNVLIYWARALYAVNHPEYVALQPATISQTLSDAYIGPFFATWMLVCAPILFLGVALLVWAAWVEFRRSKLGTAPEMRRIQILSGLVVLLQAGASVGMVMLSHFRFPDNHVLHMQGSYLFFFSQAFVIVVGEMLSRAYARQPDGASFLSDAGARLRRWYVWVPIGLGVLYLSLFVLKGYDLGAIYDAAYLTYTLTEPVLLTSFLGYVLTYHFDMGQALWAYLRSRSSAKSI